MTQIKLWIMKNNYNPQRTLEELAQGMLWVPLDAL
jgi:hypothetical protein